MQGAGEQPDGEMHRVRADDGYHLSTPLQRSSTRAESGSVHGGMECLPSIHSALENG
jgi:hypothetical protein